MTIISTGETASTVSPPLGVIRSGWLIATGDADRVTVLRSFRVQERKRMFQPVRRFIAEHGLVLAARETFVDQDWMGGAVEMSVYVPAATRNANYARSAA